jgi:hypothetical protein
LEYFAMGRPVVLPNTNLGLRVNHGREGYVLLRCDAEGIAAAVQEIKADGGLARRLSDGAVDFYLSQVEQGSMGVGLNDFYGRLIGKVSSIDHSDRPKKLHQKEKLNGTVATYKSVITHDHDFDWEHHNLGDALEQLEQFEKVVKEIFSSFDSSKKTLPNSKTNVDVKNKYYHVLKKHSPSLFYKNLYELNLEKRNDVAVILHSSYLDLWGELFKYLESL